MNKIGVGCASITELEKKYVMDALESERLSQGSYVAKFEKEFARLHNQKYGIMCSSGTAALHVALEILKEVENWNSNTEVLVPAVTFIATSNACIQAGLKPVFVDVDEKTYNINPAEIEKHINENTRAIIPVHTFGQPCEMDEIMEIAKKYNLKVIEDCAEAHFAKYKNQPVGSFGSLAASSTYVAHTITTGIGGIIITNDRTYMEIARSLIAHGRDCTCEKCIASDPRMVCPKRMNTEMDRRFLFVRLGYSYRIGEIEGALGLAQLERVGEIMSKRKENARYLTEALKKYSDVLQLPEFNDYIDHTFMMYPIVVRKNSTFTRDELTRFLEKNNIETRPMLPLLNQPVYKRIFGNIEDDYPVAKWINRSGFYIGCHHGLGKDELNKIKDVFDSFFKR
ncbi:DegT/DnrJ/EryC1/StrS family aminotransferase [Fonticella tunisiensis]|uniref:CDP-6-deoxy-D-xylo-4-hexulose-3-dehydrase/perosamine synthetase n=1 Tax=Fonticella tunisiensis TaxID=1096341 RepID=A0A4R7KSF0_9CLOT|nr:DegT/DnrJ/EryC1/StrS family aminotransferase [Fonticella tunisiensis]TDT61022.1 CDP-6-deoxy-D-xylo-4-hexulose-3-dehydrase/perosamine synthetase [Fonticella tunisiensis]